MKKIVICIKAIRKEIVFGKEERNEKYVINPYDLYALQACVHKKEEFELVCLCMGGMFCEEALIKAMAIGADEAILLSDFAFGGSDTIATSYILAEAIQKIGDVSMVVCGEKSVDGETGQVSAGIAARLDYVKISKAVHFEEIREEYGVLLCEKEGQKESIQFSYPAVVSFCNFTTIADNVSLLARKRAQKKGIQVWSAADLGISLTRCGLQGSKTKVLEVENTVFTKKRSVLPGSTKQQAQFIVDLLVKGKQGSTSE